MSDRYRVGIDIGGTFTDFVLFDAERRQLRLHKCLTTPKDPAAGALEGLEELLRAADLACADVGHLVHGTTLVTNAIIERSGAALGLLTTRGFRDSLEMGIEQRYDIYDLFLQFPEPLAPRAWRREIDERVSRDGEVIVPIDLDGVRREVADLVAQGVEAIAVCFLHAYKNPAHERRGTRGHPARLPVAGHLALLRGRAGAARVRARDHDHGQCLRAAPDGPLRGPAGRGARRARVPGPLLPDAVLRRHGLAGDRAGLSHPPARVGAGRRRTRHRLLRRAGRASRRHLLRHGRHDGQGVPHPAGTPRHRTHDGGGPRASLQAGERPAHQDTRHRHDRDRRGRGQHRAGRSAGPAQGRPAQRGRRPRTGLLRARRQGAHGHRRQPDARLPRPRVLPRGTHAPRRARRGGRHGHGGGAARPEPAGGRLGRLHHRLREHGGGGARAHRREGARPAALRHGGLRRRGSGPRRAGGAHPRRSGSDRAAGLGRGLRARLPGRPDQLRAGHLAARRPRRAGPRRGQRAPRRSRGPRARAPGRGRAWRRAT